MTSAVSVRAAEQQRFPWLAAALFQAQAHAILDVTAVPAAAFIGDNHKGTWLPNKAIAQKWMQYVTDTKVIDTTPPPAPKDVAFHHFSGQPNRPCNKTPSLSIKEASK